MTLKKSLISIAAAGVIAATMTGCGSSGGSSSSGGGAAGLAAASAVEVVDGKVLNAVVTGTFSTENNTTADVVFEGTRTSKNVVTNEITKGDYVYKIPEANASILDDLRFITVTAAAASIEGTESYPASFIDVDGNLEQNLTAGDLAYNLTLTAPKGVKYVSPVSTLVYEKVKANLSDPTKEVNATEIENAINLIAAKLNLSADDIKNVDPLATGKEEFGFINAQLAGANLATLATALTAADANATSFGAVIDLLADKGATGFANLKTLKDAGELTVDVLPSLNFDKVRESGDLVLNESSSTAFADINNTKVDTEEVAELLNTGDKIANDAGSLSFEFKPRANDESNASASVDLLIYVANPKAAMEDTAKQSNIAIKLANLDVVKENGTPRLEYNSSKVKISYEWLNAKATNLDVNYVSMSDKNDTVLDISSAINKSGDKLTSVEIPTLIDLIDTNASAETNDSSTASLDFANIADLKVLLADASGALQKVNSKGAINWTSSSIAGANNVVAGSGKVVLNLKADMRGTSTTENNAPTITSLTANGDDSENILVANDDNLTLTGIEEFANGVSIVANKGLGSTELLIIPTITIDSGEQNTSVTVSKYPSWVKVNNNGVKNGDDLNLTIDTNGSTAEATTVATVRATDEFDKYKAANDVNLTFVYNLAPALASGKSLSSINDANSTGVAYEKFFTNINGVGATVANVDTNSATVTVDGGSSSIDENGTLRLLLSSDVNETSWFVFKATDPYGASADFNVTITNDDE